MLLSKVTLSHPAGITSNVQCVCSAAGWRTQAGDVIYQCFQSLRLRNFTK